MQVELVKKNMEIDKLNQQIVELQRECEAVRSSTTGVSSEPTHEANEELLSSVEYQPQIQGNQPTAFHAKLKELESQLESTKLTMEDEREKHKEKVKQLETEILHQQSVNQVWQMYMLYMRNA